LLPADKKDKFEEYYIKAVTKFAEICTTEPEIAQVLQNRERYTEIDALARFYLARECDEKEALKMYEAWIRWRAEFKADCIDKEEIKPLLMKETIIFGGKDKENRLSIVVRARYHNPGDQNLDQLIRYGIFLIEQASEKVRAEGLSPKFAVIYDRTGMTSANKDSNLISFVMKFVKLLQDYYAERLHCFYILKANWVFKGAYFVIKPFLSTKTKDKMNIIGDLEDLKNSFDETQLLPEYGGTLEL
jgi:hypothetical protein